MKGKLDLFDSAVSHEISLFQESGLGILRGVFAREEIDKLTAESERLWREQDDLVPQNIRVGLRKNLSGDVTLERLDPVADISRVFASINIDTRMQAIASAALNETPTILKEKLIYKWPGTSGYGAHRDEHYFDTSGVPGDEMVSVSIALDEVNAENGAIKFYPDLRNIPLDAPDHEPRDVLMGELESSLLVQPELKPGDIVIFDGLIPHWSDFNCSKQCRRMYTVTYGPARYPDCRKNYYAARLIEMERERKHEFPGPYFIR